MKYNILLEGGGAKGIGHLGVIKAIIHYRLELSQKIAGTSAGALVALLFASGYNPDQILSDNYKESLIPKKPFDLVQPSMIKRLAIIFYFLLVIVLTVLVPFILNFGWEHLCFLGITVVTWGVYKLSKRISSNRFRWLRILMRMITGLLLVIPTMVYTLIFVLSCFPLLWRFGIFKTKNVEVWLRKAVSKKLTGNEDENYTINFKKFKSKTGYSLSIIATNLTTRSLHLFSPEETPEVDVIDATIASISIPIFFKYKEIKINEQKNAFVDGGIVSNYPAWIHSNRSFLSDFDQTIGVRFEQGSNVSPYLDSIWCYFKTFFLSTLWGAQRIETSSLYGLQNIHIKPENVSTLSFNNSAKLLTLKEESQSQATQYFFSHFSVFSQFDMSVWQEDFVIDPIRKFFSNLAKINIKKNQIRSALLAYIHEENKVSKLIFTHNMDDSVDRFLEFNKDEGFVSASLAEGISFLADLKNSQYISVPTLSKMQRYELPYKLFLKGAKKKINSEVELLFMVPIYDYSEVREHHIGNWNLEEIRKNNKLQVKSVIGVDILFGLGNGDKIDDSDHSISNLVYSKLKASPEGLDIFLNHLSENWSKSLTQLSRDDELFD